MPTFIPLIRRLLTADEKHVERAAGALRAVLIERGIDARHVDRGADRLDRILLDPTQVWNEFRALGADLPGCTSVGFFTTGLEAGVVAGFNFASLLGAFDGVVLAAEVEVAASASDVRLLALWRVPLPTPPPPTTGPSALFAFRGWRWQLGAKLNLKAGLELPAFSLGDDGAAGEDWGIEPLQLEALAQASFDIQLYRLKLFDTGPFRAAQPEELLASRLPQLLPGAANDEIKSAAEDFLQKYAPAHRLTSDLRSFIGSHPGARPYFTHLSRVRAALQRTTLDDQLWQVPGEPAAVTLRAELTRLKSSSDKWADAGRLAGQALKTALRASPAPAGKSWPDEHAALTKFLAVLEAFPDPSQPLRPAVGSTPASAPISAYRECVERVVYAKSYLQADVSDMIRRTASGPTSPSPRAADKPGLALAALVGSAGAAAPTVRPWLADLQLRSGVTAAGAAAIIDNFTLLIDRFGSLVDYRLRRDAAPVLDPVPGSSRLTVTGFAPGAEAGVSGQAKALGRGADASAGVDWALKFTWTSLSWQVPPDMGVSLGDQPGSSVLPEWITQRTKIRYMTTAFKAEARQNVTPAAWERAKRMDTAAWKAGTRAETFTREATVGRATMNWLCYRSSILRWRPPAPGAKGQKATAPAGPGSCYSVGHSVFWYDLVEFGRYPTPPVPKGSVKTLVDYLGITPAQLHAFIQAITRAQATVTPPPPPPTGAVARPDNTRARAMISAIRPDRVFIVEASHAVFDGWDVPIEGFDPTAIKTGEDAAIAANKLVQAAVVAPVVATNPPAPPPLPVDATWARPASWRVRDDEAFDAGETRFTGLAVRGSKLVALRLRERHREQTESSRELFTLGFEFKNSAKFGIKIRDVREAGLEGMSEWFFAPYAVSAGSPSTEAVIQLPSAAPTPPPTPPNPPLPPAPPADPAWPLHPPVTLLYQ